MSSCKNTTQLEPPLARVKEPDLADSSDGPGAVLTLAGSLMRPQARSSLSARIRGLRTGRRRRRRHEHGSARLHLEALRQIVGAALPNHAQLSDARGDDGAGVATPSMSCLCEFATGDRFGDAGRSCYARRSAIPRARVAGGNDLCGPAHCIQSLEVAQSISHEDVDERLAAPEMRTEVFGAGGLQDAGGITSPVQ